MMKAILLGGVRGDNRGFPNLVARIVSVVSRKSS